MCVGVFICLFMKHVGNVLQIQMPMSIIVPDDGTICIKQHTRKKRKDIV